MQRMSWVVSAAGVCVIAVAAARADSRTGREVKSNPVSFRMASTTPVAGYEQMTVEADKSTVYVSPRPLWSGADVVSVQTREGGALQFTLNQEAATRVESLSKQSGDRLAVFVDGKLASVGVLSSAGVNATISNLPITSTERVLQLLNGVRPAPVPTNPISASMTLVPAGVEGDLYFVDVFAQGVTGLRAYQVSLTVEGGSSGELVREEIQIDELRPDYIFSDLDVIAAADQVGGRAAGILKDGVVDRTEPGYLGTYAFRATPDASGTFQISIDRTEKSLLGDSSNEPMEFVAGAPAMITIGPAPRQPGSK